MAEWTLAEQEDLNSAIKAMLKFIIELNQEPLQSFCITMGLKKASFEQVLAAGRGYHRFYFKSRDRNLSIVGIGAAHILHSFAEVLDATKYLTKAQLYCGGIRFDELSDISIEWQHFGCALFILPLLALKIEDQKISLQLNYSIHNKTPFAAWRDYAQSLLGSIGLTKSIQAENYEYESEKESIPKKDDYLALVAKALIEIDGSHKQKVVLGRRSSTQFNKDIDPLILFLKLTLFANKAGLFFFDDGRASCFFGASPELLYRRLATKFFTESLAGTRPRALSAQLDQNLGFDLLKSPKEQIEQALVSSHVEEGLKDLGISIQNCGRQEVLKLPFVQHLIKRYEGQILSGVGDADIIKVLHPTPAVSGTKRSWALDFIREHEGFDRGLYAGPIGIIGIDEAEFLVAIRSALYYNQQLFIYAACGILPGSIPLQEWAELDNKEKNIRAIFLENNYAVPRF